MRVGHDLLDGALAARAGERGGRGGELEEVAPRGRERERDARARRAFVREVLERAPERGRMLVHGFT